MAAMLGLILVAASPRIARAQGVELVKVDVALVDKGYRTSKLLGQTVVNEKNEKIGTLDDIILGQDRRMYGVLQVGGFLGIGKRLIAVPFDSLTISDAGKKVQLPGASKEELKKLTEFKYQG
jgi:sporulation protein YlmC with PRC-barrel domain